MSDQEVTRQFGRYQVKSEFGSGSMATVYRAYDPDFDREVALKVIAPHLIGNSEFQSRFKREARIIAALKNEAIIPVYDFGIEDNHLFLVMPLMEGGTLTKKIELNIPINEIANILDRLALALDAAHAQGIVHRDLKPDNILFDNRGNPYICDFGIAKIAVDSGRKLTQINELMGTPAYMSPEQIEKPQTLDKRSDIYSLGIILFEMLTSQNPYDVGNPYLLAYKHIHEPVPKIVERNPDLPFTLQAVIDKVLAKNANDRYPKATQFAEAVRMALSGTQSRKNYSLSTATVTTTVSNPFVYGRPVQPYEFLGREPELRTVFNRVRNGESTAIVGDPLIGKSSMLLKLGDEITQRQYFGVSPIRLITSPIDLHSIPSDYTANIFWEEALEPLFSLTGDSTLIQHLEQTSGTGYPRRHLERLFNHLNKRGIRLILLLDEFERLQDHPQFQTPAFFALLRSLATRTGGLVTIIASRLSVFEMNQRGRGLLDTGSPFFNHMIEVKLRPFDREIVEKLLNQVGSSFSSQNRRFIHRAAGSHPFLLQAMAATFMDTPKDKRKTHAEKQFYKRVSPQLNDLWMLLDSYAKAIAVILSLVELTGDFQETTVHNKFDPRLEQMEERGLIRRVKEGEEDINYLQFDDSTYWTIGSRVLAQWIRNAVFSSKDTNPSYGEWLGDKEYQSWISEDHWNLLINSARPLNVFVETIDLSQLREKIQNHFSLDELRNLCHTLDINHEDIAGDNLPAKARELVSYCKRQNMIEDLITACQRAKPNVSWPLIIKRK